MIRKKLRDIEATIESRAVLFERESDLDEFLGEVLGLIADFAGADLSFLYLYEQHSRELVLRSYHGPAKSKPTANRISVLEGQVGQALRTVSDATVPIKSRLMLPIRRGPVWLGVLILTHTETRGPTKAVKRGLGSVVSLLGATLEEVSLLLEARESEHEHGGAILGQTAAGGFCLGTALLFETGFEEGNLPQERDLPVEESLGRFDGAVEKARSQLTELRDDQSQLDDIVSLIFSAHLLMLNDPALTGAMREQIASGQTAEGAVRSIVNQYARLFAEIDDVRIAEKAQDVRDLGYRLLRNLSGKDETASSYHGQIVVARHIYPSELVRLAVQKVGGAVLMGGGVTAHIAILAESLAVPVLITTDKSVLTLETGTPLLLDAAGGRLYVRPSQAMVDRYTKQETPSLKPVSAFAPGGDCTADNVAVQLLANVNLYTDARDAMRNGAAGIGLYRSEFPFIIRNDFLGEEEQFRIYRRIVKAAGGGPVLLRTADVGGDKLLRGREEVERNPFLGVRGIRFSLANREMFREQLRAMLRAGEDADLGIMLPMVSGVEEVEQARDELGLCLEALSDEGIPHNPSPRLGAMVELPSAAMAVEDLAATTDFLSVGTNDLVMYLLAVDRTNERLSELYRSHHPTVLRVIAQIAQGAGPKISQLCICGDSASDPLMIPFYLGIGVRKLSVAPPRLERTRMALTRLTIDRCETIAADMLAIRRLAEMDSYLEELGRTMVPSAFNAAEVVP